VTATRTLSLNTYHQYYRFGKPGSKNGYSIGFVPVIGISAGVMLLIISLHERVSHFAFSLGESLLVFSALQK